MEISNPPSTHLTSHDFLHSVLRLAPRVAAFDCDGTLWSSDAGETFFDWEVKNAVVPSEVGRAMRARYAEYKAGKVREDEMCGEMVTMHKGISEDVLMQAASEFMAHVFAGKIFPEIRTLIHRLHEAGSEVWAISSSNEWVIRAGMKAFAISDDRIVATKPVLENGIVTDRLVRIPTGPGKVQALREVVGKEVDAAFGNSRWDTEMLAFAKRAFAINPNPDLEAISRKRGWTVYFPDGTRRG
jgi:phosphoserine phosphatase